VQSVAPGSSEAAAGIRGAREIVIVENSELGVGGDLIIAVDGEAVGREDALVRAFARKRVGETITLTIVRGQRTVEIPVRLLAPTDE
jgi:S1-C subfamily serine protease